MAIRRGGGGLRVAGSGSVPALLLAALSDAPQRTLLCAPQDTQDPNPLIRALAVRTMGCIRVDKIVEYLCEPLRKCLKDEDPYVRKTSAVCVAKLYDINGVPPAVGEGEQSGCDP